MRFRATAYNQAGDTFQLWFCNPNWHGIEDAAARALAYAVLSDNLHQRHGPWQVRGIDVSA